MASDGLPTSLDISTFNTRNGTTLLPNGAGNLTYTITSITAVPEPTTAALLGLGLIAMGIRRH
jgi:hypothetical protein